MTPKPTNPIFIYLLLNATNRVFPDGSVLPSEPPWLLIGPGQRVICQRFDNDGFRDPTPTDPPTSVLPDGAVSVPVPARAGRTQGFRAPANARGAARSRLFDPRRVQTITKHSLPA